MMRVESERPAKSQAEVDYRYKPLETPINIGTSSLGPLSALGSNLKSTAVGFARV